MIGLPGSRVTRTREGYIACLSPSDQAAADELRRTILQGGEHQVLAVDRRLPAAIFAVRRPHWPYGTYTLDTMLVYEFEGERLRIEVSGAKVWKAIKATPLDTAGPIRAVMPRTPPATPTED